LLVRAFFINALEGWVVGHDAVILHTLDGGERWTLQYIDEQGNTPLFDVFFRDPLHGLAVGAYGRCLQTDNGGKLWQSCTISKEEDFHLNRLTATAAGLFIAAESGRIYRSQDQGKNWQALDSGYPGSLFGILELSDGRLMAYGLRGHVLLSSDSGEYWQPVPPVVQSLLTDAIQLPGGRIIISGTAGTLLLSSDAGKSFQPSPQSSRSAIMNLLPLSGQRLLLTGEKGVTVIQEPGP